MRYIAHRGLINGPSEVFENNPLSVDEAIANLFEVEVDLWVTDDNRVYLGHDRPKHKIDWNWVYDRKDSLWIHCKNTTALVALYMVYMDGHRPEALHYFWHQQDTVTLTSKGYMWVYPGKQPVRGSIAVLPETYNDNISQCVGICSDYVLKYREDARLKTLAEFSIL